MKLNEGQQKAVSFNTGPLMVVAGAGTGKTTVLTEKVKAIIESGIAKPSEILALTFTEKAAREMEERIDKALPMGYVQTWISTFHSFGEQILRQEAVNIGLDSGFQLLTQAEAQLFIKQHLYKFDLDYFRPLGNPLKFISGLSVHFSRLTDEDVSPERYLQWVEDLQKNPGEYAAEEVKKYKELAHAYQTYHELKNVEGLMDFGDLIFNTLKLFRQKPDVLKRYQQQFKYILVDEFQDTNFTQVELSVLLASAHQRITVFLDDDQSIYRFRGAAVYNAMDFRQHFPQAEIAVLTQNYRSVQPILDFSHQLISHNNPDRLEIKEHIDKKLMAERGTGSDPQIIWEERGENEADIVAQQIIALCGESKKYQFKDVAVLVRANSHADIFTHAFARKGIPFQFLGPGQLYNRPEIKDLLAYFRVITNIQDDMSLYRLLTKRFFGIDRRDIALLVSYAREHNYTLFETMEMLVQDESLLGIDAESLRKITKLLKVLKRHLDLLPDYGPGQLLYYFLEDTGLLSMYQKVDSEQKQQEVLNISRFFDEVKSFESRQTDPAVLDWLEYIEYVWAQGESPLASEIDWTEANAVNILTTHSAKGLEFPIVFLVNLVNDRFPTRNRKDQIPLPEALAKENAPEGDAHVQEERRLFYVGMTRAKDRLFLTGAKFYGENKRPKKLSGFVHEAMGEDLSKYLLPHALEQEELPLFGQFSSQDAVNIEESKAVSPHHVDYLTYSRLNSFQVCPMHYYLQYVLNLPTPTTGALSFGTTVHNTMKQFYQWVLLQKLESIPENQILIDQILEIYHQQWINRGFDSKEQQQQMKVNGQQWLQTYIENEFNPQVLPIEIEMPFNIKIKDLTVGGRIDRVDRYEDGTLEIIDYKTGKMKDEKQLQKDLQLAIYGLAATEKGIFNQPIDQLKLAYYFFEAGEKVSVNVTPERLENAKEEILEIKSQIEQSNFACSEDYLCQQGCEYDLFCNRA
ncbi:ATP-dependent helicase [candidate division WWE3 bacterium]|uniref:DNA 3'-5' helicase n=1 Tax=candidate division WWE3 bacterium TaxID=2053526 RepID=A0A955LH77_UNCKA|nr:ATP-dependent helicase [candidate division WWE3 bacterium]